jgi:hypothetical protein
MMMGSEQSPAPSDFPFDRVVVADKGGTSRDLSPSEFFALPLAQRIQYVVEQKAAFFSGARRVDSKEALAQMRKLRTQIH